jgi:hypothetical protein
MVSPASGACQAGIVSQRVSHSQLDDESLVEQLLTLSKTHDEAAHRFVNDYGNASIAADDERHPANWSPAKREDMTRDAETLRKVGVAIDELVTELVRRRSAR